MARRGSECFLVRRVADRGIDNNIGDSRARDDRFNCDRRFAAGGNVIGNRDPRDILKIKRLRQRVRDLELQRERRVKETESGTIVWDEVNEEEEHPFSHPNPRFFEPIYEHESGQECLSECEPRFDEDKMHYDEDEYLWVQRAINGVTNREDEAKVINHYEPSSVSSGMFVEDLKLAMLAHDGGTMPTSGRNLNLDLVLEKSVADSNVAADGDSMMSMAAIGVDGLTREMISEVELFKRTVMKIIRKRVDVPFDPGGYNVDSSGYVYGKLEDEFFRRGGV